MKLADQKRLESLRRAEKADADARRQKIPEKCIKCGRAWDGSPPEIVYDGRPRAERRADPKPHGIQQPSFQRVENAAGRSDLLCPDCAPAT